jgi:hypothetical protein
MPSCPSRNPELPGCNLPGLPSQFRPHISGLHPVSQRHRFPTSLSGIITNKLFGSTINMESWLVGPHASPPAGSASNSVPSLYIFDFLSCITSISHCQNLLLAVGLTPLQARHLGNLIYYCFVALPFKSSLLGSRIFTWLRPLDVPAV